MRKIFVINFVAIMILFVTLFIATRSSQDENGQVALLLPTVEASKMVATSSLTVRPNQAPPLPIPSRAKLKAALPLPTAEAQAYLVAYLPPEDISQAEILLEKNASTPLPIASITKLLTALTSIEELEPYQTITFLESATKDFIDPSIMIPGETFYMRDLLHSLLIESSNDSALALAKEIDQTNFMERINLTASRLGLDTTRLVNPSGLDPENDSEPNQSSAKDLLKLVSYLLINNPDILAITTRANYDFYTADGHFHHQLLNTNQLLKSNGWPAEVIGGKTGTTTLAQRNLVLILRDKLSGGYLVSIVLNTTNHFSDTRNLIDWTYQNYEF